MTNIISGLGAGSGIDIQELTRSLVSAERDPAEQRITSKISEIEASISGWGTVTSGLSLLSSSLQTFNATDKIRSFDVTSNDESVVQATADGSARSGDYRIAVSALAESTSLVSGAFASKITELNSGESFSIGVSIGGEVSTLAVETDTPQGLVDTINDSGLGLTASLVDVSGDGSSFQIILEGQTGVANALSLDLGSLATVSFTESRAAADAAFDINGVSVSRSSNSIDDLIDGVTFDLRGLSATEVRLSVRADTSDFKQNLEQFVTVYNQMGQIFDELASRDVDPDDPLVGSLAGDSALRRIRSRLETLMFGSSEATSENIRYLSDIGVRFQQDGTLAFESDEFDSAMENYPEDVETFLTGNQASADLLTAKGADAGFIGILTEEIAELTQADGFARSATERLETRLRENEDALVALEDRMSRLQDRYIRQFTAMDLAVTQFNQLRESMKDTLANMPYGPGSKE